jgi:hypothetical protein
MIEAIAPARLAWLGGVLAIGLTLAPAASAQSLTDALTFLITNQSVSTGDPNRDEGAARATSAAISRALLANLATLPVATSSSGFLYRLNPELGTVERATQNFGPFFVERALTEGRHKASLGATYQVLRFTALDGHDLRDGTLVTTANQFIDETQPFDVDRLALEIAARIVTVYGKIGLTDDLEVGFAVPLVDLTLNGTRVNTYRGTTSTQATVTARAVGLSDIVAHAKYMLYDDDGAGLATAVDVRLPTGRQDDMLGTGRAAAKLSAIGSLESGSVSTYANAGLSVGGLAREVSYSGALAVAATPRLTLTGELLGRWMQGVGHIVSVTDRNPALNLVETTRLTSDTAGLNLISVVAGLKWNVSSTWMLATNVTIPVTSGGLTAPVTPFIGLDYAFAR